MDTTFCYEVPAERIELHIHAFTRMVNKTQAKVKHAWFQQSSGLDTDSCIYPKNKQRYKFYTVGQNKIIIHIDFKKSREKFQIFVHKSLIYMKLR